jgi:hypothetical protein
VSFSTKRSIEYCNVTEMYAACFAVGVRGAIVIINYIKKRINIIARVKRLWIPVLKQLLLN